MSLAIRVGARAVLLVMFSARRFRRSTATSSSFSPGAPTTQIAPSVKSTEAILNRGSCVIFSCHGVPTLSDGGFCVLPSPSCESRIPAAFIKSRGAFTRSDATNVPLRRSFHWVSRAMRSASIRCPVMSSMATETPLSITPGARKLICVRRTFARIPCTFRAAALTSQVRSKGKPVCTTTTAAAAVVKTTMFLEDAFIQDDGG